jgi:hypothetical protein
MQTVFSRAKNTHYLIRSMINTTLKINCLISTLAFFLLISPIQVKSIGMGQGDIPQALIDALRTGNTTVLSGYFNTSIELAILDKEDIYSKQQAELIVKDFFAKHVPSSFVILHKGGKEGSQYAIGNLTTSAGNFRVTLLIKQRDNKPYIHQLRFEVGNAE